MATGSRPLNLFENFRTFARVAQRGSFSQAARDLETTQPAVSKQIAALEAHCGFRLFERTTRHLRLTEEGLAYLGHVQKVLGSLVEADALIEGTKGAPRGLLRLGAPYSFGRRFLLPHVAALLQRYPMLRIEVVSNDLDNDLVEHGLDLAVRFGEAHGDLVARRVGISNRIAVASSKYLEREGTPATPLDLSGHQSIVYCNPLAGPGWTFSFNGKRETIAVLGNFLANSAESVREACLCGLGIAVMPEWLFHDDIALGRVERVLREYEPEGLPIYIAYQSRKHLPPKVKVVADYLADALSKEPALGWSAVAA